MLKENMATEIIKIISNLFGFIVGLISNMQHTGGYNKSSLLIFSSFLFAQYNSNVKYLNLETLFYTTGFT